MASYYPQVYHSAVNWLVQHGPFAQSSNHGRWLVAQALKTLRAKRGRHNARAEYYHLAMIGGMMPQKRKTS